MTKMEPQIRLFVTVLLYSAVVMLMLEKPGRPNSSHPLGFYLSLVLPLVCLLGAFVWIFWRGNALLRITSSQPLLVPEWGLLLDLAAPLLALAIATPSLVTTATFQMPGATFDKIAFAPVFIIGGYIARRSLSLLRGRLLLDPKKGRRDL